MTNVYEIWKDYLALFGGLDDFSAFGTGRGQWVKRPLRPEDVVQHLQGGGAGIGLPPLRTDNTCLFAAIDLDEADFEAAREMQGFLPGPTWLEKSRSGNAHVWAFFKEPIEAWVPMGIMREACLAAGKQHVEIFPKNHDHSRIKLGNYINLPYHGDTRPIFYADAKPPVETMREMPLHQFIAAARMRANDPDEWRKRARWLMIEPPEARERNAEFGKQADLHICAQHVLENAETNPVTEGHRAVVYFALAKQLTNWELCDHDEALMLMRSVSEASPDPISDYELRRILSNAERGQYTSTGCDDPLFAPYAHPDCPIIKRTR